MVQSLLIKGLKYSKSVKVDKQSREWTIHESKWSWIWLQWSGIVHFYATFHFNFSRRPSGLDLFEPTILDLIISYLWIFYNKSIRRWSCVKLNLRIEFKILDLEEKLNRRDRFLEFNFDPDSTKPFMKQNGRNIESDWYRKCISILKYTISWRISHISWVMNKSWIMTHNLSHKG